MSANEVPSPYPQTLPVSVASREFDKVAQVRQPSRSSESAEHSEAMRKPVLTITGAAGLVGTLTHERLLEDFDIRGLDIAPSDVRGGDAWWHVGSLNEGEALDKVLEGAAVVVLAATGVSRGWDGVQDVEIAGTAAVCAAAVRHGVQRFVLVSSNHATGMQEVDGWEGQDIAQAKPSDVPRPDGLYGAAKVFAEATVRSMTEIYNIPASVIRLGGVRLIDDPDLCDDGPRNVRMNDAAYQTRMRAAWMSHDGWERMLREELMATDRFRVRYGSDNFDKSAWSGEVLSWNRTAQ